MKIYKALLSVFLVTSVISIPGTNIAKEDQKYIYCLGNLQQSTNLSIPFPLTTPSSIPAPTFIPTTVPAPDVSQNNGIRYYVENAEGTKQFLIMPPAPNIKDDIFMTPPIINDNGVFFEK